MKITYDATVDSLYIQLRDGIVDDTLEQNQYIFTDVDKDGAPLGIEILFATRLLGRENLSSVTVDLLSAEAVIA